ncbi:hypothetical protein ACE6H2_009769 [Prunus campanulata]
MRSLRAGVDFELAGWGAAMEDFCSLLEMLWRPLIFVWGGELRIQRLFRYMKLSVCCDTDSSTTFRHLLSLLAANSCILCLRLRLSSCEQLGISSFCGPQQNGAITSIRGL